MPDGFEELDGLRVVIDKVIYMPDLEAPEDRPHPFVYFIHICNDSDERITILGRKWIVREEANRETVVVEGDGVVGQTPEIEPGERFSYNSYHVVASNGTAEGGFFGKTGDGRRFFVRIPGFTLEIPAGE